MNAFMLLTKNILVEDEFCRKLNCLGYEVFCTKQILDDLLSNTKPTAELPLRTVLISDTVPNDEAALLIKIINKRNGVAWRLEEAHPSAIGTRLDLTECTISKNGCINELREVLFTCFNNEKFLENQPSIERSRMVLTKADWPKFSKTEHKIFSLLFQANGSIVSREEICKELWRKELNHSKKSHISRLIRDIRKKMDAANIDSKRLETKWKSGYQLNLGTRKTEQNISTNSSVPKYSIMG